MKALDSINLFTDAVDSAGALVGRDPAWVRKRIQSGDAADI